MSSFKTKLSNEINYVVFSLTLSDLEDGSLTYIYIYVHTYIYIYH